MFLVGLSLCHQMIGQPGLSDLWQKAMENGLTVRLFRDETIQIHQYIQIFFEPIKG